MITTIIRFCFVLVLLGLSNVSLGQTQLIRVHGADPPASVLEVLVPEVVVQFDALVENSTIYGRFVHGNVKVAEMVVQVTEATERLVVSFGYTRLATFQCPDRPLIVLVSTEWVGPSGTRGQRQEVCAPSNVGIDLHALPVLSAVVSPMELAHDRWLPVIAAGEYSEGHAGSSAASRELLVGYIAVSLIDEAPPSPNAQSTQDLIELRSRALGLD